MTGVQSCQPEAATPYQHVCSDVDCCYQGQPSFRGCGCHKTREQMMLARIEDLTKALEEIAGKNDLSKVAPEDEASAAFGALHECELIARGALAPSLEGSKVTDIVEWLRHTAGHLINGTTEDGTVEAAKLCQAADTIEQYRADAAYDECTINFLKGEKRSEVRSEDAPRTYLSKQLIEMADRLMSTGAVQDFATSAGILRAAANEIDIPAVAQALPTSSPHVEYSASRGQSKVTYWVSREEGDRIRAAAVSSAEGK